MKWNENGYDTKGNWVLIWKAGLRKKNKQLPSPRISRITTGTKLCDKVREIVVTMADACGS